MYHKRFLSIMYGVAGLSLLFATAQAEQASEQPTNPPPEPSAKPATKPMNRGIGVYLDQDMFIPFGYNEDRDYTMGMAIEFFWEKDKGLYPLDGLVETAGKWFGVDGKDPDLVYSFMFGIIAYTPDDLAETAPIYDDRPYSSLIYLSNKRVRANRRSAVATEVLLGLLGTNVAGSAQTHLHTYYRSASDSDEPVDPLGWSHQISDGGELTMRLRLTNSQLKPELSNQGNWDVATSWGVSLGFQTNANVGLAIRSGSIKSSFWSLPFDPVTRGNFLPSKSRDEWYFWSAIRVHLIIYDAMLQGQFRHSDVTYSYDEIEHAVYDGAFGFTFRIDNSQISLATNIKTSDVKILARKQVWGSLNYIYHF